MKTLTKKAGQDQGDDFTVRNLEEVFQAQETSSRLMSAIASASLIVGGNRHHGHHAGFGISSNCRPRLGQYVGGLPLIFTFF
jgi:hypothetical protein